MSVLNRASTLTLLGIFAALGSRGCGLAVEDFGTGPDATLTPPPPPPPDASLTDAHDATVSEASPPKDALFDTPPVDAPVDAPTPLCDWSRSFGDQAELHGLAVDASGNVAFGGRFEYSIDLGSGLTTSNAGPDAFLAVLDSSGATLWSHITSGVGGDGVTDVAFDTAGNVLALITSTTALAGGGIGTILVKYDASGTLLWTRDIAPVNLAKLAVTADDSIVVMHQSTTVPFATAWTLLDPTGSQVLWQKAVPGVQQIVSNSAHQVAVGADRVVFVGNYLDTLGGPPDFGGGPLPAVSWGAFVAAFTLQGSLVFSNAIGVPGMIPNSVSVAPNGDVYVAGRIGSSAHATLVRLDQNGTSLYEQEFDAIVFDYVDVDARSGGVTLLAGAAGGYDFGGGKVPPLAPEQYEYSVTQFDATPTFQKTRGFGGNASGPAPPHVVVRDAIYVGGTFEGSMDFGQGPLVAPNPPQAAIFVARCPL